MTEQALIRLAELQREYEVGQRRLQELVAQEVSIRETLLRISGAIQVLAELTGQSAPAGNPPAGSPPARPAEGAAAAGAADGAGAADAPQAGDAPPGTVLRVG
jgi:hypothetical protein